MSKLKDTIKAEYEEFCKDNGCEPNVAYVKVKWYDEKEPEPNVDTIVLDANYYYEGVPLFKDITDEDVLYYCENIDDLLGYTEDNNFADFVIVEFVGFGHLE